MNNPTPAGCDGLIAIRAEIARAAADSRRSAGGVELIAVSKTQPREAVERMISCGQRVFGENRVQEAAGKFPGLREICPELRLHLIGPLQTNKVREAVALFDAIDSLDREKLADALENEAQKSGRLPRLLIQVNIGAEPQKAGVLPDEADGFITDSLKRFPNHIKGLMCIPPAEADALPHFQALARLALRFGLPVLSMGMSGDFPRAIAAGATEVRVGTALFGSR